MMRSTNTDPGAYTIYIKHVNSVRWTVVFNQVLSLFIARITKPLP